ncbi:hypothetical protein [Pseudomonas reinekei]|nr:hypothetical protein [Pseudomonas reinekei]KAB0482020.1 hypothetical protein F7R15_24155 [Pseudomonas reinekei]OLT99949.1 hypothetical protein BVK86_23885 [Pseudomonas reinekei]
MHRQATELNSAFSYAFTALVRKDSEFQRPHRLALSERGFTQKTGILNFKWRSPRAYVAWPRFTLAGIIIKLSTKRLTHQSGFLKQCGIDLPCARKPLPFVGIDLPIPRWKGCLLTFNQLI